MNKVHVWKEYRDQEERSWCRRTIKDGAPKGPKGHSPMSRDLEGATCLECVRLVRDAALGRLRDDGVAAFEANELLDSLRRKQARNRRKTKEME